MEANPFSAESQEYVCTRLQVTRFVDLAQAFVSFLAVSGSLDTPSGRGAVELLRHLYEIARPIGREAALIVNRLVAEHGEPDAQGVLWIRPGSFYETLVNAEIAAFLGGGEILVTASVSPDQLHHILADSGHPMTFRTAQPEEEIKCA